MRPLLLLALLLGGCAAQQPLLAPALNGGAEAPPVELTATPFFPQTAYQCGPAALATVLGGSGVSVAPETLADMVYLPGRKGSLQPEMVAAVRRFGRLAYPLAPTLDALLAELQAGHPVLVLENLGLASYPVWHYAVVVGYRPADDTLVLRSGEERRRVETARKFLKAWTLAGRWAVVALRPGELPARPEPLPYLQAAADLESTGQLEAAHGAYMAAVNRWPDNATAWLGLGNSSYGLGRLAAAQTAFRTLLARHPDDPIGHNNLAQVLSERGCAEEALTVIDQALAQAPADAPLRPQLRRTRAEIAAKAHDPKAKKARSCPDGVPTTN